MEARTVADSRSVLVHWMGPTDANSAGFVHGGVVMKLIDEVAGLAAVRHSHQRVVTAGADRMTFEQPIHVGQLVTLHASVNAAWNTSMEVGVRVEAETPDELRREAKAQLRRSNRLAERDQILAQRGSEG